MNSCARLTTPDQQAGWKWGNRFDITSTMSFINLLAIKCHRITRKGEMCASKYCTRICIPHMSKKILYSMHKTLFSTR
jgi:hypothetical protein